MTIIKTGGISIESGKDMQYIFIQRVFERCDYGVAKRYKYPCDVDICNMYENDNHIIREGNLTVNEWDDEKTVTFNKQMKKYNRWKWLWKPLRWLFRIKPPYLPTISFRHCTLDCLDFKEPKYFNCRAENCILGKATVKL